MSSDVIADMLTAIRNATLVKKDKVDILYSKLKLEIIRILKEEGFIANYKKVDSVNNKSYIRVFLKYTPNNESVIREIVRVSKPGRRIYRSYKDLKSDNITVYILTTPKGVITDKKAKELKVGGEVICYVR
ncbi:MAG: 30S ribosomal protein S8 [Elusimicrobiota bacterium]|nr:30S ribosomal protein S8 [Endomicrobiia bacterium]MDW8165496.1 30S ribosomal protein S8 [Elusimicrobiota bacterium]